MKKYFFARLFVRTAKGLALFVLLIGIGFCALRFYQANLAADSAAYQPSPRLQPTLDELKDTFLSTEQIVDSFNAGNQSPTPSVEGPRFPLVIDSSEDLDRIAAELSRVDQERQKLKESVVMRFETLVKSIEEKLRAYAAVLQPSPSPPSAQDVVPADSPPPPAAPPDEALFSSKVDNSESRDRYAKLTERKEFLKALGTKAENAENRTVLGEAADQLERLAKLLPEKFDASAAARIDSTPAKPSESQSEQGGNVLLSERVAHRLEQLRASIRQTLLTSWTLDDAFEQASSVVSAERDKYRAATLAQKGIWISASERIAIGLLAAGLVALLMLVFGDLVQTQLDTASSSVTVADAINALRGSIAGSPMSESMLQTEIARPITEERRPVVEEEPVETGGS